MKRLAALSFILAVTGVGAFADPDWNRDRTVRSAAYCVAVFEIRADMAAKWSLGGPSLLDIHSAERIMEIADKHDRAACHHGGASDFGGIELRGPFYPSCGRTISDIKYAYKLQIQSIYEESGLTGAFPPTCREDPACVACRDFVRTLAD